MRVVFFGTPEPAAVALAALLRSRHQVGAVVTQPDRPRGRSGGPRPSPVKVAALEAGLDVLQPSSPRDEGFAARLESHRPEACAVVAYGHLLPTDVLAIPPRGTVNVHFSLLPAYRGAAPVQRAIMNVETESGVSTFLLEPTFDTGPILLQVTEQISPEDSTGSLLQRLAPVGARLLVETLDGIEAGTIKPLEQDPTQASAAPKIRPEEGAVDWRRTAVEIANLVRALDPSPGAYGRFRGKRIKLWRALPLEHEGGEPGTVVDIGAGRLGVATGDGVLELLELQAEGARRMQASEFVRGHRPAPGETFGAL